jgi:hypothetical protein
MHAWHAAGKMIMAEAAAGYFGAAGDMTIHSRYIDGCCHSRHADKFES